MSSILFNGLSPVSINKHPRAGRILVDIIKTEINHAMFKFSRHKRFDYIEHLYKKFSVLLTEFIEESRDDHSILNDIDNVTLSMFYEDLFEMMSNVIYCLIEPLGEELELHDYWNLSPSLIEESRYRLSSPRIRREKIKTVMEIAELFKDACTIAIYEKYHESLGEEKYAHIDEE